MRRVSLSVCAVLAAAGSAAPAMAQTDVSWANPSGGLWGEADNWSPTVVPNNFNGETYNALLSSVDSAYVVTMAGANTIENFTMDEALATLNLTTQTLIVNQNFTADVGTITSSGGGLIVVAGETVFGDVVLMSAGKMMANGNLKIASPSLMDICDTDVDYGGTNGQAAQWEGNNTLSLNMGGTLKNGSGSLFQVSPDGDKLLNGDGTGTLTNEGELVLLDAPLPVSGAGGKVAIGRGLDPRGSALTNDTLRVDGAKFFNDGGVTVLRGDLDLAEAANDQTLDGELNRGRWTIRPTAGGLARVVFPSRDAVFNINTQVTLLGEGAVFSALDGVSIIGSQGRFEIGDNRSFQTQDSLAVIGELVVGQDGFFDATNGLDNINNGVLSNGSFTVSGIFLAPSFTSVFAMSETTVRLIGPDSEFPVIDSLQVIGGGATFSVEGGRFFETQAGLRVLPGGVLRVDANSALSISEQLLSAGNGTLFEGDYEIGGTMVGGLDPIFALQSTRLALYGPGSQVLDFSGSDAIGQLQFVDIDSVLEVRGGRVLVTDQNFTVDGTLIVDPASAVNPLPGGLVAPITAFETLDTLYVRPGSIVRVGVTASGESGVVEAGQVEFENEQAGLLAIDFAAGPSFAVPFSRTVIRSGDVVGGFKGIVAVGLDPTLKMTSEYVPGKGLVILVELACPADLNGDGILDNGDIGVFIELFIAGHPSADLNGDGILDNGDIGEFVAAFIAGC